MKKELEEPKQPIYNEGTKGEMIEHKIEKLMTKRQPSKTYTIKSFAENTRKLKQFKWINKEEEEELERIVNKIKQKYIDEELK